MLVPDQLDLKEIPAILVIQEPKARQEIKVTPDIPANKAQRAIKETLGIPGRQVQQATRDLRGCRGQPAIPDIQEKLAHLAIRVTVEQQAPKVNLVLGVAQW
jgi:hypothetical protein